MGDVRNTKKIYQANVHRKATQSRRKDDVENNVRKMSIVIWRQVAEDRDERRRATREALILRG
jgi:hypothetical protein